MRTSMGEGWNSRGGPIPPLLLVALGVASAAAPQPPRREMPVFGSSVTLVAVPVFVTDKSGKSVSGLTAADFEVEDAGKRTPIVAFQEIDVDAPATEGSQAEMAALPVAVQAAAPRQFLLLLDSRFSPRAGLFFARKAATDYVRDSLASGDLVAVATTGPAGLRVLANFTSDHEYVSEVIAGTARGGTPSSDPLGFSSTGISGGVGSLISDPVGIGGISAGGSGGGGGKGVDADAEFAAQDALMAEAARTERLGTAFGFLDDLKKLVQSLAPLRGRKQIVLFSGGFPEDLWAQRGGRTAPDGEPLLAKMKEVYRLAGQADVVIHTIDLVGLEQSVDLSSQLGPNGSLDSSGPASAETALKADLGRGTLIALSVNTGGQRIPPRGDFGKAFGQVDEISRHSYVLAFEASENDARSERPRSLKVRVRRPGLSVSHRPEYSLSEPKAASSGGVQMLASEAIGKGLSGGRLRLRLQTLPYRDREGAESIQAVLRIDGPALAEAAQGKTLGLQVYGYAMDKGRVLNGLALNTSIDLAKVGEALRKSGINLLTSFPVPAGNADLRFFVRAGSSDLTGSIQKNVAVPAFAPGGLVLSAPLFALPPAGQVVVPFQPQNRPPIPIPFYVGDDRFVPDAAPVLTRGQPRGTCVFVWREGREATAPLKVTGEIVRPGHDPVPLRFDDAPRVATEADGFDRYLVTVQAPEVEAGDYLLRLRFAEPGTGRVSKTETPVVIQD